MLEHLYKRTRIKFIKNTQGLQCSPYIALQFKGCEFGRYFALGVSLLYFLPAFHMADNAAGGNA